MRTEQPDGANLGGILLGKHIVAGDGLDLNFALRHVVCVDRLRNSEGVFVG